VNGRLFLGFCWSSDHWAGGSRWGRGVLQPVCGMERQGTMNG